MATKEGDGARLKTGATIKDWKGHRLYNYRVSYIEAGKYKQKGFKTKKKAKQWIATREKEIEKSGNEHSLTFSEKSVVIDARKRLAALGVELSEVVEIGLRQKEADARSATVSELLSDHTRAKERTGISRSHLDGIKRTMESFGSLFGDRQVSQIDDKDIEQWMDQLGKKFGPRTINHHRTRLRAAFARAVKKGYVAKNVVDLVEPVNVVSAGVGVLTADQLSEILDKAAPEILPAFLLGAFAGLRDSEIKSLRWENIDAEARAIHVTAKNAKSSKERRVEIEDNLLQWLAPYQKKVGPVWPRNGRKLHDTAKIEAGFANPDRLPKKKRETRAVWLDWPVNALRHSYASHYLAHFQNINVLALNMGHKDADMIFAHYRKVVSEKAAKAYWSIRPDSADNVVSIAS